MKLQEATRLRVAENVIELVGETPLLHLRKLVPPDCADVYAKLETMNPGGSIKDRAAIGMIKHAEEIGELREGSTIIEATAGNTGIGLALIGVNKGYRVIVCVPQKFAKEKVMIMQALGAEVIRTPDDEGMKGAIQRARDLATKIPNSYLPLQFENQSNPEYHYHTTGREIVEQLGGHVDAVVIGAGTGGTFSGVARYVKEHCMGAIAVAVETVGSVLGGGPPGDHKIEGIGASFIPSTFHGDLADEIIKVTDPDGFEMVRQLARQEGVLAGSSAGANVWASLQVAKKLGPGKKVATIIPDSAERYLSKNIFETY
jgi:cysteine synthase A